MQPIIEENKECKMLMSNDEVLTNNDLNQLEEFLRSAAK